MTQVAVGRATTPEKRRLEQMIDRRLKETSHINISVTEKEVQRFIVERNIDSKRVTFLNKKLLNLTIRF